MENTEKPKNDNRLCIEVEFRGNTKRFYRVLRGAGIKPKDWVVVRVEKGTDLGKVVQSGYLAELKGGDKCQFNLIRKANDQDLKKQEALFADEKSAFLICKEKIEHHGLNMNLAEAEKQFDESKITFYFLAEKRVDFRELVKDLANTLHTRIELRQIGVRDEAGRRDGVGVCGRRLCCSGHLKSFPQISTQMARAQHLSINQSKLSGVCGRLKCCLKYELQMYEELTREMPPLGKNIETEEGPATITGLNILKNQVKVRYTDTGTEAFLTVSHPENGPETFLAVSAPKEKTV